MRKSSAIVITLLVLVSSAFAQSLTAESFAQAKAVLDRSVAAYGGVDELNAISNVSLRIVGETVHRNQSKYSYIHGARRHFDRRSR